MAIQSLKKKIQRKVVLQGDEIVEIEGKMFPGTQIIKSHRLFADYVKQVMAEEYEGTVLSSESISSPAIRRNSNERMPTLNSSKKFNVQLRSSRNKAMEDA